MKAKITKDIWKVYWEGKVHALVKDQVVSGYIAERALRAQAAVEVDDEPQAEEGEKKSPSTKDAGKAPENKGK